MRPILLTLTLLASTMASAQSLTAKEKADFVPIAMPAGCPVGIFARHQGSPATIWTTSLEDSAKPVDELKALHSGLHVVLNAPNKQIKQAELTVFFLPTGTRVMPVTAGQFASSPAARPETSKKFSLAAGSASHRLDGDLLLGPVASISHVSLMHVIYSDGSEWNAPNASTCSREPSKFMPVDAK